MLMNLHPVLQTMLILITLFLITEALAEGIKNGNLSGTLLAFGSMVALGVCIHLARKLAQTGEEEERA